MKRNQPPRRSSFGGVSLVEAVVAVALTTAIGLPLLSIVRTSDVQVVVSEDVLFAQILALRHLEMALAETPEIMATRVPIEEFFNTPDSLELSRTEDFPSYLRQRGESDEAYRVALRVDEVEEGLLRYAVSVTWPSMRSQGNDRELHLVRLRCLPTTSLRKVGGEGQTRRRDLRRLP